MQSTGYVPIQNGREKGDDLEPDDMSGLADPAKSEKIDIFRPVQRHSY